MRAKKFPFEARQLVEAKESCVIDVPDDKGRFVSYTFNSKTRPVRAEHPAVVSAPQLFKPLDVD